MLKFPKLSSISQYLKNNSIKSTIASVVLWILASNWAKAEEIDTSRKTDIIPIQWVLENNFSNKISIKEWVIWNINIRDLNNPDEIIDKLNKSNERFTYIPEKAKKINFTINNKVHELIEIVVEEWSEKTNGFVAKEYIDIHTNIAVSHNSKWRMITAYIPDHKPNNIDTEDLTIVPTISQQWNEDILTITQEIPTTDDAKQLDNFFTEVITNQNTQTKVGTDTTQDLSTNTDQSTQDLKAVENNLRNNDKQPDPKTIKQKVYELAQESKIAILKSPELKWKLELPVLETAMDWVINIYDWQINDIIKIISEENPDYNQDVIINYILRSINDKFLFYIEALKVEKTAKENYSIDIEDKQWFKTKVESVIYPTISTWDKTLLVSLINWFDPKNNSLNIRSNNHEFFEWIEWMIYTLSNYFKVLTELENVEKKIWQYEFITLQAAKNNWVKNIKLLASSLKWVERKYKDKIDLIREELNSNPANVSSDTVKWIISLFSQADTEFTLYRRAIQTIEKSTINWLEWVENKDTYYEQIVDTFRPALTWNIEDLTNFINWYFPTKSFWLNENSDSKEFTSAVNEIIKYITDYIKLNQFVDTAETQEINRILWICRKFMWDNDLRCTQQALSEIFSSLKLNIVSVYIDRNYKNWIEAIWKDLGIRLSSTNDPSLPNITAIYTQRWKQILKWFDDKLKSYEEKLQAEKQLKLEINSSDKFRSNRELVLQFEDYVEETIDNRFRFLPPFLKAKSNQNLNKLKDDILSPWVNVFDIFRENEKLYKWPTKNISKYLANLVYAYSRNEYNKLVDFWMQSIKSGIESEQIHKTPYTKAEITHINKLKDDTLKSIRKYLKPSNPKSEKVYREIESQIDEYIKIWEYTQNWNKLFSAISEVLWHEYIIIPTNFTTYSWRANELAKIINMIKLVKSREYIASMTQQEAEQFKKEIGWNDDSVDTFIWAHPKAIFTPEKVVTQLPKFEDQYKAAFDSLPEEKRDLMTLFFTNDHNIETAKNNAVDILMFMTSWESEFHQFMNNDDSSAKWPLQHLKDFRKDFKSQPWSIQAAATAVFEFIYTQFYLPKWELYNYRNIPLDQRLKLGLLAYYNWQYWVKWILASHWWSIDKTYMTTHYWIAITRRVKEFAEKNLFDIKRYEQLLNIKVANENKEDKKAKRAA